MLRYPGVTCADLAQRAVTQLMELDPMLMQRIDIDGKYYPHLTRQASDLKAFTDDEELLLDPQMDYQEVKGLSKEIKQRLGVVRPRSIGAAKRMEGMTPSGLVCLLRHAKKFHDEPVVEGSLA
jgi:tRNA uridine 5-carboxymethylaminomethyl modification enzyme